MRYLLLIPATVAIVISSTFWYGVIWDPRSAPRQIRLLAAGVTFQFVAIFLATMVDR